MTSLYPQASKNTTLQRLGIPDCQLEEVRELFLNAMNPLRKSFNIFYQLCFSRLGRPPLPRLSQALALLISVLR